MQHKRGSKDETIDQVRDLNISDIKLSQKESEATNRHLRAGTSITNRQSSTSMVTARKERIATDLAVQTLYNRIAKYEKEEIKANRQI